MQCSECCLAFSLQENGWGQELFTDMVNSKKELICIPVESGDPLGSFLDRVVSAKKCNAWFPGYTSIH